MWLQLCSSAVNEFTRLLSAIILAPRAFFWCVRHTVNTFTQGAQGVASVWRLFQAQFTW